MSTAALLRLAGLVFIAVSLVVIGDTAGKNLTGAAGVDPGLVAFSRFALAALILLPFLRIKSTEWRHLTDWRLLLRAALIAGGISSILTALRTAPLPDVFGAFFIGPIISYGLAVLFLGEKSTWPRLGLLLLGFFGVMLVVKPGFGMTPGLGFALLAGAFYGCYLALTRAVADDFRPGFLLISQLLIGAVLLIPMASFAEMPELNRLNIRWFLISALGSAFGNYLLVLANRIGEASLIAPLVYTQLISATIAGIWAFGGWPDPISLIGLTLILLSGLGSLALVRDRAP